MSRVELDAVRTENGWYLIAVEDGEMLVGSRLWLHTRAWRGPGCPIPDYDCYEVEAVEA